MEVRSEAPFANRHLAIAPIDHAGNIRIVPARFEPVQQCRERLARVAGDAQIGADVLQALGGQDAERRPAAQYRRVADRADALHYVADARQVRHRVEVALVVQIADGQPHQVRLELPDRALHVPRAVVRKHQVQNLQLVAVLVHSGGYVRQPNRNGTHHHPVHEPVGLIGRYQQYPHRESPKFSRRRQRRA